MRPNAFMQNFLEQSAAIAHGALPGPEESLVCRSWTPVTLAAWQPPRCSPPRRPAAVLEVTGPEALSLFDVAETMSAVLGRTVTHYPASAELARQGLLAMGRPSGSWSTCSSWAR